MSVNGRHHALDCRFRFHRGHRFCNHFEGLRTDDMDAEDLAE